MRIQKEIENVERIENRQPVEPLTVEDAVIQHKKAVDKYEEERKEINKELDLDDDIEEKGFTGASKEPKKVSTPELKKMKLSESLFESVLNETLQDEFNDEVYNKLGDIAFKYHLNYREPTKEEWQKALDWFMEKFFDESLKEELENTDGWGDEIEYRLEEIFSHLENLMYEIRNCRRGVYTGCETAEELADLLHMMANDLDECSQDINADRNSINESLNEDIEEINMGELLELVDRYNTSIPVSGDWDTETQHEQKIIADHFNLSMEEAKQVMIDMLGFEEDMFPVEEESLEEAKINRQNQRRKRDANLQRKEAEREKAEEEAREKERIGDAAWGEKDWIAEREKGDLDFSNYSDEEKAEIEKRLKAFDDNPTAQAQYKRKKEAEEAKRAEEERKKAEQEKEERTKKNLERIGKAANAPKDIGNAFKKGLGNAGIHIG